MPLEAAFTSGVSSMDWKLWTCCYDQLWVTKSCFVWAVQSNCGLIEQQQHVHMLLSNLAVAFCGQKAHLFVTMKIYTTQEWSQSSNNITARILRYSHRIVVKVAWRCRSAGVSSDWSAVLVPSPYRHDSIFKKQSSDQKPAPKLVLSWAFCWPAG